MTQLQSRPIGKRIGGLALMLVAVAMIGYCVHYLALTGNCSGSGYLPTGPVKTCGGGEALYITGTFFVGPVLVLIGWLLAQVRGLLWPATCVSLGTGLMTLRASGSAAATPQTFGQVTGGIFYALAVLAVVVTVRNRRRKQLAALAGPTIPAGPVLAPADGPPFAAAPPPAPAPAQFAPSAAPGRPRLDPLDTIARLAQLRDSGAITEAEFQREKAKLLEQL